MSHQLKIERGVTALQQTIRDMPDNNCTCDAPLTYNTGQPEGEKHRRFHSGDISEECPLHYKAALLLNPTK